MHTIWPNDVIEVETVHGRGVVLYITVNGGFQNDLWCVANKADGELRHYQTIQLKLAETGVLGVNEKGSTDFVEKANRRLHAGCSGLPEKIQGGSSRPLTPEEAKAWEQRAGRLQ